MDIIHQDEFKCVPNCSFSRNLVNVFPFGKLELVWKQHAHPSALQNGSYVHVLLKCPVRNDPCCGVPRRRGLVQMLIRVLVKFYEGHAEIKTSPDIIVLISPSITFCFYNRLQEQPRVELLFLEFSRARKLEDKTKIGFNIVPVISPCVINNAKSYSNDCQPSKNYHYARGTTIG